MSTRRSSTVVVAVVVAALAGCAQKRWEPPPCPAGQTRCAGACVDLATSVQHCGACENACLTNATCAGGVCSACPADRPDACVDVGHLCTDLQDGVDGFCGACGVTCAGPDVAAADAACAGGTCVCAGAAIDCGANPRCVNAQADPANCGGCGNTCEGGRTCASGACACPAGKPTACPDDAGACTNTRTDPRNCGTCGTVCPLAGEVCSAGACACPSTAPDACQGLGRCVNLATDAKSCGTCGHVCPVAGEVCSAGTCGCPPSAPTICGAAPAACTSTSDDERNCGACGHACAAGQICSGGTCIGCPGATPNACGSQCCASTLCCDGGTSCATARPNGLGQSFFSCDPPGTWSAASAEEAARAWEPTPIATCDQWCSGSCLGWQTATRCAVWCFDGSFQGQVSLDATSSACLCPPGPGVVTTW